VDESRLGFSVRRLLLPLLAVVLSIALCEFSLQVFSVQQFLVPAPSAIFAALVDQQIPLWAAAQMALVESIGGILIGGAFGIGIALLTLRWSVAYRALLPFAIGLNAVPTLIIAPIMNNWFGSTNPLSKMMIVAALVYYPVLLNTLRGLSRVDAQSFELMRTYAATESQTFWKLRVPNALPYLFNALKISATLSVIGTVVAGYFGGPRNALGVYILNEVVLFRFPTAWAGIVVACSIGLIFFAIVSLVERAVLPWQRTYASS
jgi:NitT/TauT family transport system permease protein